LFRRLRIGLKDGFYFVTTWALVALMKSLFRLRVIGREHLKRNGTYIAVARHRSYWDIPLMIAALGACNRIHFIARRGLMKGNPVAKLLIRAYATIIDRERFSKMDFRRVVEACKRERLVGLFPEGTTRRRVDAKAGAIRFAMLANKLLLPVNIRPRGPYPPRYPFRYPRVTVSIGEAFSVTDLQVGIEDGESRPDAYRRMTARLMERVDTA
jgi:1-acyl-sn-glycerol-3-phosphate acyltransferase